MDIIGKQFCDIKETKGIDLEELNGDVFEQ